MTTHIAIHASSLCLDILNSEQFRIASCQDIRNYYDDILTLVETRLSESVTSSDSLKSEAEAITKRVISLLVYCKVANHIPSQADTVLSWFDNTTSVS